MKAMRFQSFFRHGYPFLCVIVIPDLSRRLPANPIIFNDTANVLPWTFDKFNLQVSVSLLMKQSMPKGFSHKGLDKQRGSSYSPRLNPPIATPVIIKGFLKPRVFRSDEHF